MPALTEAVNLVFGGTAHQIVCEETVSGDAGSLKEASRQTASTLRGEATSRGLSQSGSMLIARSGTGLPIAAGLLYGRNRHQRRHWIVAVVDCESLSSLQTRHIRQELREADSRFLLIVRGTAWPGNGAEADGDMFDDRQRLFALLSLTRMPYAGEVDGTVLHEVVSRLEQVRQQAAPAVLYVQRSPQSAIQALANGRGTSRQPAPKESTWHPTATPSVKRPLQAFFDVALEMAAGDRQVVLAASAGLREAGRFAGERPWQFHDFDVQDGDQLSWCAGAAAAGCRPVLVLPLTESQRILRELRASEWMAQLPLTLVFCDEPEGGDNGQHRQSREEPETDVFCQPQMCVMMPADVAELRAMTRLACAQNKLSAVVLPRWLPASVNGALCSGKLEAGKGQLLYGRADDVVVIAAGELVAAAVAAQEALRRDGVFVSVINLRFIQPLDQMLLAQVAREARHVVVLQLHENPGQLLVHGGLGDSIRAFFRELGAPAPVTVLSLREGEASARVAAEVRTLNGLLPVETRPSQSPGEQKRADCPPELRRYNVFSAWQEDQRHILGKQLSSSAQRWVEAYSTVGNRSSYLWKWCLHGVELTTLPSVREELRADVCDTKLLSIVLCVLFDDVADQHGDRELLETLLSVAQTAEVVSSTELGSTDDPRVALTRGLWRQYELRRQKYPCRAVFEDLLKYDLSQFFNTMRYSHLINRQPYLLNMAEHDLYTSHNMLMISFSTLDLMCSPDFRLNELGRLREIMWHAQCMGRIGNLLSTWEREIADRDFSSGIFARAINSGDVTIEELLCSPVSEIKTAIRQGKHERYFFERWEYHHESFRKKAQTFESFDLTRVLKGHERFLAMHLGSRGLI